MKRLWLFLALTVLLATSVHAANEISCVYPASNNLYFILRNAAGQVWEPSGNAFETFGASGHTMDTYDTALTDKTGSFYIASMDTGLTTAGLYTATIHLRAGGSPADSDPAIAQQDIYWSGTAAYDPAYSSKTLLEDSTYGLSAIETWIERVWKALWPSRHL